MTPPGRSFWRRSASVAGLLRPADLASGVQSRAGAQLPGGPDPERIRGRAGCPSGRDYAPPSRAATTIMTKGTLIAGDMESGGIPRRLCWSIRRWEDRTPGPTLFHRERPRPGAL